MSQETPLVTIARLLSDIGDTVKKELLPEEAEKHFRASLREALLGGRSLLDSAISRLDEHDSAAQPDRTNKARNTARAVIIDEESE